MNLKTTSNEKMSAISEDLGYREGYMDCLVSKESITNSPPAQM